jgi:hypothetical protein
MSAATRSRYLHPEYRPGQMAPATAIYLVVHKEHRPDHEAIIILGEEFPTCRTCKGAARFSVERQASHITHDFDFAGPKLQIVKK